MTDYEQIENYLQGNLKGNELQQFEARLQADPDFAEAVQLYRNINNEIWGDADEQALKLRLSALGRKHTSAASPVIPLNRSRRIWYLGVAAAAVAAAIIFIIPRVVAPQIPVENLFAELTARDSLPVTVRGNQDQLKAAIAQSYNNQRYTQALLLLEQYSKGYPADANYNFAKAVCYAETGDLTAAMNVLDDLITGPSVYKHKAVAEKARILFTQGRRQEAANLLKTIPSNAAEYQKAQQLIKALE